MVNRVIAGQHRVTICRLNSVKNINFGLDQKKYFWHTEELYFGSLNIFVYNELFEKTPFSDRKMHFFDKNVNLTTCSAQLSADVKEFFFRVIILHRFLKRKLRALLSKNVQANLTLLNLAQKGPFLDDLKKKVSKSDWNKRHLVYVNQIHYYTWF